MNPVSNLKLVSDRTFDDMGPFKLERRHASRYHAAGRVTAVMYATDDAEVSDRPAEAASGGAGRIGSLQLLDMSAEGVGCWSQDAAPVGSKIAMFFPPHGPEKGFDVVGRVVRCEREDAGYALGIELEHRQSLAA